MTQVKIHNSKFSWFCPRTSLSAFFFAFSNQQKPCKNDPCKKKGCKKAPTVHTQNFKERKIVKKNMIFKNVTFWESEIIFRLDGHGLTKVKFIMKFFYINHRLCKKLYSIILCIIYIKYNMNPAWLESVWNALVLKLQFVT